MKISIVVAAAENNAIGKEGNLLWHLPKDLDYFKNVTWGHHVLMGRKSWESIPEKYRPLKGRTNIVVTRQKDFRAADCKVVSTMEEGIAWAEEKGEMELMIIGGGEIYRQAMARTDKIYLTRVHHSFPDADTFFPALAKNEWALLKKEFHKADTKHKFSFEFTEWERTNPLHTGTV